MENTSSGLAKLDNLVDKARLITNKLEHDQIEITGLRTGVRELKTEIDQFVRSIKVLNERVSVLNAGRSEIDDRIDIVLTKINALLPEIK